MRLLWPALLGLVLLACGPIDYLNTVTRKATRAVAEARAAGGEQRAPYEYWSAVEYLHMAKEKAAYADYQIAIRYGEKAESMAADARRLAAERRVAPRPESPGDETPPDLSGSASPAPAGGKP
jgi:hypothetical protein